MLGNGPEAVHRPRQCASDAGGRVGVVPQVHSFDNARFVAVGIADAPQRGPQRIENGAGRTHFAAGQVLNAPQKGEALVVGDVPLDGFRKLFPFQHRSQNMREEDAGLRGHRMGVRNGRYRPDLIISRIRQGQGRYVHERSVAVRSLAIAAEPPSKRGGGSAADPEGASVSSIRTLAGPRLKTAAHVADVDTSILDERPNSKPPICLQRIPYLHEDGETVFMPTARILHTPRPHLSRRPFATYLLNSVFATPKSCTRAVVTKP